MKKEKTTSLSFSNRNLKATKEKILLNFFKKNDMPCNLDLKTNLHPYKANMCFFLFILSIQQKNYLLNKSMQMTRTKQKELCYTTIKQTLECPKFSINPT